MGRRTQTFLPRVGVVTGHEGDSAVRGEAPRLPLAHQLSAIDQHLGALALPVVAELHLVVLAEG